MRANVRTWRLLSSGTQRSLASRWRRTGLPINPTTRTIATGGGATFAVMEAEGRGGRFNFSIDDPDLLWQRLKDVAVVIEPLFDTPYGTRKFTIADPDGNELGFVRDK